MKTTAKRAGYYYGWNIVALTVLAQLASFGIAINCMSLYLPLWSMDLHASVSTLSISYTSAGMIFCLLGPATGHLVDKLSARWMVSMGLAGVALLFALCSQVTRPWQLIALFSTLAPVSMVIAGVVPAQALVSRWFERRRGMALGFSGLGLSGAGAILPPMLAVALPALGWRHTFLLISGFVALCVPIAFLLLRDRPEPGEGEGIERLANGEADTLPAAAGALNRVFGRPTFWILALTAVATMFMSSGYLVNLAAMAGGQGLGSREAGTLISILSVAMMVATLAGGYAADRFGGRIVLGVFVALGVAGTAAAQLAPGYAGLLAGTILIGPSGATVVPIAAVMAREFGLQVVGRALGFIAMATALGTTAPPVFAFMREATGSYHAPLMLLGGVGVLALLALLTLRERAPSAEAPSTVRPPVEAS